jgi:general secretion pathway protein G
LLLEIMALHEQLATNDVFLAQANVVAAYLQAAQQSDETMKAQVYQRVLRVLSRIQRDSPSDPIKAKHPGLDDLNPVEQTWVLCRKCGQSYQIGLKQYYMEVMEKAKTDPSPMPVALPLTCKKCGQDGIVKACKCEQCGEVFREGSVPNDFPDRCPKCKHSRVEALRKANRAARQSSTDSPDRARVTAARTQIAQLRVALDTFELDVGRFPTTAEGLSALVEKPASDAEGWQGPYIRGMPNDPWGRAYGYRQPGQGGPRHLDLYSAGPDGQEGTDDDITN